MRIGIDLFSLVPSVGRGAGFHRYVHGLVSALGQLDDGNTYVLFLNSLNAQTFAPSERFIRTVVPLPPQRELWPARLAWQHGLLPVLAARHRLDLVHFPLDTASFALGRPYVVTINDLIADVYYPAHFPASQSRVKSQYLFRLKRRSARRAMAVLCPSETTSRLVAQHYGVPREKIHVVPYAADEQFFWDGKPRPSPGPVPYVLSVVSLSPHKNIATLVDAFARARQRFGLAHRLHIVGMPGTDPRPIERYLAEQRLRGLPVHYLGFVEDAELRTAYAAADLFVYLSLVEGFGLPPLEAMASGVPVIASKDSSLPEVCGDAACLVPPQDVEAVASAIGRVLTNPPLVMRLVEAGKRRAAQFSWSHTARQTIEVYQQSITPQRMWTDACHE